MFWYNKLCTYGASVYIIGDTNSDIYDGFWPLMTKDVGGRCSKVAKKVRLSYFYMSRHVCIGPYTCTLVSKLEHWNVVCSAAITTYSNIILLNRQQTACAYLGTYIRDIKVWYDFYGLTCIQILVGSAPWLSLLWL